MEIVGLWQELVYAIKNSGNVPVIVFGIKKKVESERVLSKSRARQSEGETPWLVTTPINEGVVVRSAP